ncbi:MAG: DoxX family protein [Thermoanaerobaculia bacterium]|nr:DoxX family protein [Thermoanaerobaculia bacterium]
MKESVRKLFFAPSENSVGTDIGLLVLRVAAGLMLAFGHGLGKLPPSEKFIAGVGGLGFPVPVFFAWAAALSEFAGGILVATGFLTRPAAFFVMMTMGTAAFLQHAADPFPVKEKALLFLSIAICVLLAGAGRYSIDRLMARRSRNQ